MRIRITNFLGVYPALVMVPCGVICLLALSMNGPIFAKMIMAVVGFGMIAGSSLSAMEYIEIDREDQSRQEPPEKDPVARPEVAPVKRDRYKIIKVAPAGV